MTDEVSAFGGGEVLQNLRHRVSQCIEFSGNVLAKEGFEFGKSHLDRIEIWTVRRQVQQRRTDVLDGLPHAGRMMTGEVVACLLYTSPSPRDRQKSRMPSSA